MIHTTKCLAVPLLMTSKSCKQELSLHLTCSWKLGTLCCNVSQNYCKISLICVSVGISKTGKKKKKDFGMLKMTEQSKRSKQAESVKCFMFYPPVSCSAGNHMFLSLMQGIFSLMPAFWSIHIISYFSIVSSWDIHEVAVSFIRYDFLLHPFVLDSVMHTIWPTVWS